MTCRYCGTELPQGAMFCGECGRSVAVTKATIASSRPVEKPVEKAVEEPVEESPAEPVAEPGPVVAVEPVAEPEPVVVVEPVAELEPEPEPEVEFVTPVAVDPPRPSEEHHDLEATRITVATQAGDRFVLQFSTGESVTVFGTGIIGRNPQPEPGEFFDQRVTIVDPGKSVSKTHLEFGQTSGAFWVNDRYSGNGTGIRQPDSPRVSCDPGKRYLVARGSRVDIGDQFFIVS